MTQKLKKVLETILSNARHPLLYVKTDLELTNKEEWKLYKKTIDALNALEELRALTTEKEKKSKYKQLNLFENED